MRTACERCGAPLFGAPQVPAPADGPPAAGQTGATPPAPGQPQGYVPGYPGQPVPGSKQAHAPGYPGQPVTGSPQAHAPGGAWQSPPGPAQYYSPGDATGGHGTMPPLRTSNRQPQEKKEWYASPGFFIVLGLLVVAIVAGLFLGTRPARSYAELVVNGKPTMLDFYADW